MDIVSVYAWLQVRLSVGSDSREGNITASAQDSCTLRSVLLFAHRLCTSAGQSAIGTVCLSVHLSVTSQCSHWHCLSVCLSVTSRCSHWHCLSVCPSVCHKSVFSLALSVCLSVCLSQVSVLIGTVCLSVCQSQVGVLVKTALSGYLPTDFAPAPVSLSLALSVCLSVTSQSCCFSLALSVCLSVTSQCSSQDSLSCYLSADFALSVVVSCCLYHYYYYHLPQHLVFWSY